MSRDELIKSIIFAAMLGVALFGMALVGIILDLAPSVNTLLLAFGGPAAIIASASVITAYNKYLERRDVRAIKEYLLRRFGPAAEEKL